MKSNPTKVASLFIALILILTLAACGTPSAPSGTGSETQNGKTGTSDTASEIDTSKFVTISHLSLGDKPTNGQYEAVKEEWDKYLKDKVNASLEIQYIGWTDYLTQYNLLLATGEGLDMINTASDWLDMWPNAQKGAFMTLNDLLPKYAPITWNDVPESSWAEVTYKGDIIAIPEDMYSQWINHGFMYRGDWAREFGITEPIDSWEEFGQYLQGIKDNKSKDGVIPFDISGSSNIKALFDHWPVSKSKLICIDPVPGGLAYGKSDDEWWEVRSRFFPLDDGTDLLLDFAKEMKKWGDAGYWREDVLNNTADTWVQFKAGLTGTRQHHTQTYVYAYDELEREIPGADLQFFPYCEESKNLTKMSITHGATAIGANCKNPERTLMVYDLIRNDETMYKLFNWGLEGVQYEIKDGKRVKPEGFIIDSHSFSSNFWGGRMDKFELKYPSADMVSNWREIYDNFESYARPYRYGRFVFDKSPVDPEITACTEVLNRLLPAICVGKAGDPEAAVAELRDQLKMAGNDKILAEVQRQMNEFKASIQ